MNEARTVAIATCTAWPNPGKGLDPLIEAFEARGIGVTHLPWQTRNEHPFTDAGLILPLCAWDYAAAPEAFRDWIFRIASARGRFANAPDLMLWNMDKRYLLDLSSRDVPVPPTIVMEDASIETLSAAMKAHEWRRAVLKPAIVRAAVQN